MCLISCQTIATEAIHVCFCVPYYSPDVCPVLLGPFVHAFAIGVSGCARADCGVGGRRLRNELRTLCSRGNRARATCGACAELFVSQLP